MPPALVYKVSGRHGVTRFEPRPFWQLHDFARSGSAADPAKVPPDAQIVHGVYATRESFTPFYFAPRDCPRFSINPGASPSARAILNRALDPFPDDAARLIIFPAPRRDDLLRCTFSIYAFNAADFRLLPTREYFTETAVAPVEEVRQTNALAAIEAAGWTTGFLDTPDHIRRLRDDLTSAGVTRFSSEKL